MTSSLPGRSVKLKPITIELYPLLLAVFFFFVLQPFVSPIPISSDVQPVATILGLIIFLVDLVKKNAKVGLSVFLLMLISGFWVVWFNPDYGFSLTYQFGLLSAALITYIVITKENALSLKLLRFSTYFMAFGVVAHFYFADIFVPIAKFLVRDIKITEIGVRGASGFASEPSFTAVLCTVHFILFYLFYKKGLITKKEYNLKTLLLFILILHTKSGTGFLYFPAAYLFLTFADLLNIRSILKFSIVPLIAIIILFGSGFFDGFRGVALVKAIAKNPSYIFMDGAAAERFLGFSIGILSVYENPLGKGGGGYPVAAREIESKYSIHAVFPTARSQLDATPSALARCLTEGGWIFILWLTVLFSTVSSINRFSIVCLGLSSIFIAFSFSIAFTCTYLLIGLSNSKDRGAQFFRS